MFTANPLLLAKRDSDVKLINVDLNVLCQSGKLVDESLGIFKWQFSWEAILKRAQQLYSQGCEQNNIETQIESLQHVVELGFMRGLFDPLEGAILNWLHFSDITADEFLNVGGDKKKYSAVIHLLEAEQAKFLLFKTRKAAVLSERDTLLLSRQFLLAYLYEHALKKPKRAFGLYLKLQEVGLPAAQFRMAQYYEERFLVFVQYNKLQAKKLYIHAAQAGFIPAYYALAKCSNVQRAKKYLMIAASKGYIPALFELAKSAAAEPGNLLHNDKTNHAIALRYYDYAAYHGHLDAHLILIKRYINKKGYSNQKAGDYFKALGLFSHVMRLNDFSSIYARRIIPQINKVVLSKYAIDDFRLIHSLSPAEYGLNILVLAKCSKNVAVQTALIERIVDDPEFGYFPKPPRQMDDECYRSNQVKILRLLQFDVIGSLSIDNIYLKLKILLIQYLYENIALIVLDYADVDEQNSMALLHQSTLNFSVVSRLDQELCERHQLGLIRSSGLFKRPATLCEYATIKPEDVSWSNRPTPFLVGNFFARELNETSSAISKTIFGDILVSCQSAK
jgi:TPR repeat protein